MPTKEEQTTTLYSHHIFLFPFKWESDKDIKQLRSVLDASWDKHTHFKLNTLSEYNEYNYFYDFVRPIIYDIDKDSPLKHSKHDDTFLDHYTHQTFADGNAFYHIQTTDKLYKLRIDRGGILLHLYNMGVGILSFHLTNEDPTQQSAEDVYAINQFGRRIYPPFFDIPYSKIGTPKAYDEANFGDGLNSVKKKELAKEIWISEGEKEDFAPYTNVESFKDQPFQLPKFIKSLFPKDFIAKNTEGVSFFEMSPILDDRMFVVSWYGNDQLVKELQKPKELPIPEIKSQKELAEILLREKPNYGYLTNSHWYEYVFVDKFKGKSCVNEDIETELLQSVTNARWVNYGTFYGVSRYSFVCLTGTYKSLGEYNFVIHHVQTLYYKMVELVLLQRASLLHFSEKVTQISSKLGVDESKISQEVSDLYREYIRFVNKIYFREVTAQEQGIELYNLLQKQMLIAKNVTALDAEIRELHDYVSLKEDEKRNKIENDRNILESQRNDRIEWLTKITTAFGIAGLIMAFFGMNYFGRETFVFWNTGGGIDWILILTVLGISVIVTLLSTLFYFGIIKRMKRDLNKSKIENKK